KQHVDGGDDDLVDRIDDGDRAVPEIVVDRLLISCNERNAIAVVRAANQPHRSSCHPRSSGNTSAWSSTVQ
ncbi:MAG: hypothetical protein ABFR65_08195, partial [Pseudomonadota bacterium]